MNLYISLDEQKIERKKCESFPPLVWLDGMRGKKMSPWPCYECVDEYIFISSENFSLPSFLSCNGDNVLSMSWQFSHSFLYFLSSTKWVKMIFFVYISCFLLIFIWNNHCMRFFSLPGKLFKLIYFCSIIWDYSGSDVLVFPGTFLFVEPKFLFQLAFFPVLIIPFHLSLIVMNLRKKL